MTTIFHSEVLRKHALFDGDCQVCGSFYHRGALVGWHREVEGAMCGVCCRSYDTRSH